jgi:RimJ/RimL family protein N-acetyltransferase
MADRTIQPPIEFETPRLRLRQWRESDRSPFAALTADPEVMAFLLPVPTRADSDTLVERFKARIAANGWGFWAVEHKDSGEFAGFTGLNVPLATLPFSPCVEIGWRFARRWWGQGLARQTALPTSSATSSTAPLLVERHAHRPAPGLALLR